MLYLGLFVSIFFYFSEIAIIALYYFLILTKKYEKANIASMIYFLHSLIVVMILSWALILMNGGFNVNFYLNINYNWLIALFVIFMIGSIVSNYLIKKNLTPNISITAKISAFLLPLFNIILFIASTTIFFFNCNYFFYLFI
ncbi:MAG: hypothetical protein ACI35S_03950 [Anaeroplasma sp.]